MSEPTPDAPSMLQAHTTRLLALTERYEQIAHGLHERHTALIAYEMEHPHEIAEHGRQIAAINAWWQVEHAAILAEYGDLLSQVDVPKPRGKLANFTDS